MSSFRPLALISLVVAGLSICITAFGLHSLRHGPDAAAPSARPGWEWSGVPGYRFGHDEQRWNLSRIRADDLGGLDAAFRSAGARVDDVRVLAAVQPITGRFAAIAAAGGRRDARCLGFLLDSGVATARCSSHGEAAPPNNEAVAYLVLAHMGPQPGIVGVVDGSVRRVELASGHTKLLVYPSASSANWGTFSTAFGSSFRLGGKAVTSERLLLTTGTGTVSVDLPLTLTRSRLLTVR
jgi:hypothetical protein